MYVVPQLEQVHDWPEQEMSRSLSLLVDEVAGSVEGKDRN